MRISDWSSDVCSSDLDRIRGSLPSGPKAILQPLGGSSLREGPTRNRRRLGVNQPARLHRNREEVMSLLTLLACILAVVLIVPFPEIGTASGREVMGK